MMLIKVPQYALYYSGNAKLIRSFDYADFVISESDEASYERVRKMRPDSSPPLKRFLDEVVKWKPYALMGKDEGGDEKHQYAIHRARSEGSKETAEVLQLYKIGSESYERDDSRSIKIDYRDWPYDSNFISSKYFWVSEHCDCPASVRERSTTCHGALTIFDIDILKPSIKAAWRLRTAGSRRPSICGFGGSRLIASENKSLYIICIESRRVYHLFDYPPNVEEGYFEVVWECNDKGSVRAYVRIMYKDPESWTRYLNYICVYRRIVFD